LKVSDADGCHTFPHNVRRGLSRFRTSNNINCGFFFPRNSTLRCQEIPASSLSSMAHAGVKTFCYSQKQIMICVAEKESKLSIDAQLILSAKFSQYFVNLLVNHASVAGECAGFLIVYKNRPTDTFFQLIAWHPTISFPTQRQLIDKLQTTLAEVKTLSGLIPICGWCKSVHNDTGCWQSLGHCVRAHTDATFTQVICQNCQEKFKADILKANVDPADLDLRALLVLLFLATGINPYFVKVRTQCCHLRQA
jgi:hypothetical protein